MQIPAVPGSISTHIYAINNSNLVAGDYTTGDGVSHGFIGTVDGNYTTFDAPDGRTIVSGLNDDGYVTGTSGQTNDCLYNGCEFLRSPDGTIRFILKQGTRLDGSPGHIIAHETFAGFYDFVDQLGRFASNPYLGKRTKWTSDISLPFSTYKARASGIAKNGTVVGHFEDDDDGKKIKGFILKQGTATAYEYPDGSAYNTYFEAVNKRGIVAGGWYDINFAYSHAFVFNPSKMTFREIKVSDETYPFATDINDSGIVTITGDVNSYIYCPHKRTCPVHAPRAVK